MKTTNVTILTAMLAVSAADKVVNFKWWMFLIPWSLITFYHAYFLHKESLFINLYNQAISNVNFSMADFKIDMKELNKNEFLEICKIFGKKFSFSLFQVSLILIILFSYQLGVK